MGLRRIRWESEMEDRNRMRFGGRCDSVGEAHTQALAEVLLFTGVQPSVGEHRLSR